MKKLLLLVLLVAGCTTIGHQPPPDDWPRLKTTLHAVPVGEMLAKCYPFLPMWQKLLGAIPEGCAYIRFDTMSCDIYVPDIGTGLDKRVVDHEYDHCAGRDHFNSAQMRDAWNDWKAAMTAGDAIYYYIRHDGVTHAAR